MKPSPPSLLSLRPSAHNRDAGGGDAGHVAFVQRAAFYLSRRVGLEAADGAGLAVLELGVGHVPGLGVIRVEALLDQGVALLARVGPPRVVVEAVGRAVLGHLEVLVGLGLGGGAEQVTYLDARVDLVGDPPGGFDRAVPVEAPPPVVERAGGEEPLVLGRVDRKARPQLAEVAGAGDALGRVPRRPESGQQDADEQRDDRDDHQQLDKREATTERAATRTDRPDVAQGGISLRELVARLAGHESMMIV
jgi:hypothetical protein